MELVACYRTTLPHGGGPRYLYPERFTSPEQIQAAEERAAARKLRPHPLPSNSGDKFPWVAPEDRLEISSYPQLCAAPSPLLHKAPTKLAAQPDIPGIAPLKL